MTDADDPSTDENVDTFGGHATITAYMSDEIVVLDPDTTLRQAAIALEEAGVGCVVVGSPDHVEGVVSERDILRAVAERIDLDATPVRDIESRHLMWATTDSTVDEVVDEMMGNYVRHVLVGENSRLVGIISMRDVLAAYLT
jgi:CBS domain-containing protein